MGKQKSVTIRMSNYQYEKLQKEAEQAGYNNLSEYLRNRLSKKEENSYVEDNYRCNLQKSNPALCNRVNQEVVKLKYEIDSSKNIDTEKKKRMNESVMEIWQLLNW